METIYILIRIGNFIKIISKDWKETSLSIKEMASKQKQWQMERWDGRFKGHLWHGVEERGEKVFEMNQI